MENVIEKDTAWSRQREVALVAGVFLLAGLLRMGWPALTEFKGDEARLVRLSLQMARLESFPLRGISSSVGAPNFPVSVWLYALPLALWRHVLAPTLFTGAVNALAVAGTWWLVRRVWGPRAALAAALLFAVCPWAVVHSRKIWAQNLLAPLVVGWGISAVLGFVERRPWFVTLHILLLALAVQVHFAGAALVPASGFLLVLFRRRLRLRPLLAGLGLALLTAMPFLVYLWRQPAAAQRFVDVAGGGDGAALSLAPWRYALLLSTGNEIHSLAGPQQFQAYLQQIPPMAPVYVLWLALMAFGAMWLLGQLRRRQAGDGRAAETGLIVLLWLFTPPLFFTWFPGEVFLHYLLPIYPAPFILAGLGLREIEKRTRPFLSLALVVSAALQVGAWATLLGLVATQATPGGFGTPLGLQLQAVQETRQRVQETGAREVLVAGRGEDRGETEFAAVYDVLLGDTPHRFVDVWRSTLFPEAPAVVLLDTGLSEAANVYGEAATSQREAPLRAGEGMLQIFALPGRAAPIPQNALNPPPQFANYVKLLGYGATTADGRETMQWRVIWQTADGPVGRDYHFFNHLLDGSGRRVTQADAAAFDPAQWRAGDVVVSSFALEVPPEAQGPFVMRVGMYVFSSGENVPVLDVAGNAAADAVELEIGGLQAVGDWRLETGD